VMRRLFPHFLCMMDLSRTIAQASSRFESVFLLLDFQLMDITQCCGRKSLYNVFTNHARFGKAMSQYEIAIIQLPGLYLLK
jgi:hypothetical protein